jgi:hypothetical protein
LKTAKRDRGEEKKFKKKRKNERKGRDERN